MKRQKIAVVLRTLGLEYDDRIRKECITLAKSADVTIFATFYSNKEEEGVTSYGIPYKSFRLVTREIFPSGKFLLIKAAEFYIRVRRHLKGYNLIWAHEEYTFLFSLLAKKNRFIWDLHEIPTMFDRHSLLRLVFNYIESRSKKIVHANNFRIKFLINKGFIKYPEKHVYIRNFPDQSFLSSKDIPINFKKFQNWLSGKSYVYLQGLVSSARYPFNSIVSVLDTTDLKIIVVGSFDNKDIQVLLKKKYGNKLDERVFFAGMVNQMAIPAFLANAQFSIVLYNTITPNARYCEANRFYQAISLGVPVITGCNEPMAEMVNVFNFGVSMKSDGRNLKELKNSILMLLKDYNTYKTNAKKFGNDLLWNDEMIKHEWYNE